MSKLHWNYFIALERDLEGVSRYIEFATANYNVYSIELAHLLFAAASEVDVIAKLLCQRLAPAMPRDDIIQYRAALMPVIPTISTMQIFVPRYGLTFTPWANWGAARPTPPGWWTSYNRVKHQRDTHFNQATLSNALEAMSGLLAVTFLHYRHLLAPAGAAAPLEPRDTTQLLEPESTLIRLPDDHYYGHLLAP